MQGQSSSLTLRQHTLAFLVVAAVIAAFAASSLLRAELPETASEEVIRTEIGVEHSLSLSLSLEISNIRGRGILDIAHDGSETIYVSTPSEWVRREVRNVPLHSVESDSPSFGFTRWHLPPRALVSFALPEYPHTLLLHNPSGIPLKVNLTRVDLKTNIVERDVVLVQESYVALW